MLELRQIGALYLSLAILSLVSCEQVLPYPDTGAKEVLLFRGIAGEDGPSFRIDKLYPITEKTFIKSDTPLNATLRLYVNGEEEVAYRSIDTVFTSYSTAYNFQPGDKVEIQASVPGLPDVSASTIITSPPSIVSCESKAEGHQATITATVQIDRNNSEGGFAFELEQSILRRKYIDNVFKSEEVSEAIIPGRMDDVDYERSYGMSPLYGADDADKNGNFCLKFKINTRYADNTTDDGHSVTDSTFLLGAKLVCKHLSKEIFMNAGFRDKVTNLNDPYDAVFGSPIDFTNLNGGKGYLGSMSKSTSNWILTDENKILSDYYLGNACRK